MAATKSRKAGPGRPAGVPNKVTKDIREMALQMTPKATARLNELLGSDNETVAMAAVREVYDRAYGKPTQTLAGDPKNPLRVVTRIELVAG